MSEMPVCYPGEAFIIGRLLYLGREPNATTLNAVKAHVGLTND